MCIPILSLDAISNSPTHLDPGRIIADCQEDDFVPLIIVSSPVNIQSRVIEAVVHNAATRGSQPGIVISLAAVNPHKYHILGLSLFDFLFPFIDLKSLLNIQVV